jgi:hypothetical protein
MEANMDFTSLYVDVDDFWQSFCDEYHRHLIADGQRRRHRQTQLSVSEVMTILIAFLEMRTQKGPTLSI